MFEGDGLLKVGGKLLVFFFFGKGKAAKKEWIGVRCFFALDGFFLVLDKSTGDTQSF